MTPKDVLRIRRKLKMTQAAMGKALDVSANTIARWERGELPIAKLTALAIEHLLCKARPK